jgi:hypothetical protein
MLSLLLLLRVPAWQAAGHRSECKTAMQVSGKNPW